MGSREEIIEKVKRLLALSRSDNEHEAALAAERAQEMLSKYNLAMSDVELKKEMEVGAHAVAADYKSKMPHWSITLAWEVAKTFDCAWFTSRRAGKISFLGVGADPEVASYTFIYLAETIFRLATAYISKMDGSSTRTKTEARESFSLGAVQAVSDKLRAMVKVHPTSSTALVPVKAKLVEKALKGFGVKNTKTKTSLERDYASLAAGHREGKKIEIRKGLSN